MRHSKRRVLKTEDIKLAMQNLQVGEVYGYPSSIPYTYEKIQDEEAPQDQAAMWVLQSKEQSEVSLRDYAEAPLLEHPLETQVNFYWALYNGKIPNIPENNIPKNLDLEQALQREFPGEQTVKKKRKKEVEPLVEGSKITQEQKEFYDQFCSLFNQTQKEIE